MKFLYKMTRVLSDGGLFPDTELSAGLIEKSLLLLAILNFGLALVLPQDVSELEQLIDLSSGDL